MEETRFIVFITGWMVISCGMFAFYTFCRNATIKRTVHPWVMTFAGSLFVVAVWWITESAYVALIVVALTPIIMWCNIKFIRFCGACGNTLTIPWIWRINFCPICGTRMGRTRGQGTLS
jgi:hypothetical protein